MFCQISWFFRLSANIYSEKFIYQRPYIVYFKQHSVLNWFIKLTGNVHIGQKGYNNRVADNMVYPLHKQLMPSMLGKGARLDDCNHASDTIQHKFKT